MVGAHGSRSDQTAWHAHLQANEDAQRDELFGQASAQKSGRVNIEERRRQRAAAQRSAASRIGEGLAGAFCDLSGSWEFQSLLLIKEADICASACVANQSRLPASES